MEDQFEKAKRELETWKSKAERDDDAASKLLMEKMEQNEAKEEAKKELKALAKRKEECEKDFTQSMNAVQETILERSKSKQYLLDKLKRCQTELVKKRAEFAILKEKFKISAQIPDTEVSFTAQDENGSDDDCQLIRGVFTISQRSAVLLQGGQAFITFEEEKVASEILKLAKCTVICEGQRLNVNSKQITMDPAVKFEIHLDVSRKKLMVYNIPPSMPEERMMDRLALSFSRPSRGGGEVEGVEYHTNTHRGLITFLHPGVAEVLAVRGCYKVDLDSEVNVQVGHFYSHQLRKFQTFCGSPKRTILLDNIKDIMDEVDTQDNLEIHFQRASNCGGEIESIKYISGQKVLLGIFCEATDIPPAGGQI